MNLGLIEVDTEETIQFANQSFAEISGYEVAELVGKKPADIFVFGENFEGKKPLLGLSLGFQLQWFNSRIKIKSGGFNL